MLRTRMIGLMAAAMTALPLVGVATATAATPPIVHIAPSVHHGPGTLVTPKLLVGARAQDEAFTTVTSSWARSRSPGSSTRARCPRPSAGRASPPG